MKIIVTTSNKYLHLIPIFTYLFNKNWDKHQEVEIVGYDKPDFDLPSNFTFYSLGEQIGNAKNFSTDLSSYFKKQEEWFIWMMDDTFIRFVDFEKLKLLKSLTQIKNAGRINLCSRATFLQDNFKSELFFDDYKIFENTQTALYRLCTQPSIWNKNFLLKYLTPDLTPWEFETQDSFNDEFRIFGIEEDVVLHNEGVTKHNIYDYNLNNIEEDQITELKNLNYI